MRLETASKQTEDDRQEDEGMEHSEQGNKEEDLQAESINVLLECIIFQTLYLEEGSEHVRGGARGQDECQEGAEAPVEDSGPNVTQCLHCSLVAGP